MVKKNKAIVSKVYIPKFILVLSKMMVNGFKMFISFGIIVIMMIVCRIPVGFQLFCIVPILIVLCMLTFGFMCILLHYGVYVEDLANVVNIVLKLVFYLTGVFYSIETRLGKKYPVIADVLEKFNPVAYIINASRESLIYKTTPDLPVLGVWFLASILFCLIGIRIIYKNENSYVKVI